MTEQQSTPGICACGCGASTTFHRGKWRRFRSGHNAALRHGSSHPSWRGGETKNVYGYVLVRRPEHPRANHGYIQRSNLVAEAMLHRPLEAGEVVHHINRVRTDDRPNNLLVMTRSDHIALHHHEDRRDMPRGENCASSRLTASQVEQIRRLAASPHFRRRIGSGVGRPSSEITLRSMARLFGVDHSTIARILDGRTWKDQ